LLLSVTVPRVPLVVDKVTSAPPDVMRLSLASRSVTVMAEVDTPFATRVVGLAVMVVVADDANPEPIRMVAAGNV
jgi:hypothetical protein